MLDDKPLSLPWADCDAFHRCPWDFLAAYMESRIIPRDELHKICFRHLNYTHGDKDMPWSISFLIALPLVLFTVYMSKCLMCKGKAKDMSNKYLPQEEPNTSDDESDDS